MTIFGDIKEKVGDVASGAGEMLKEGEQALVQDVGHVKDVVVDKAVDAKDFVGDRAGDAKDFVGDRVDDVKGIFSHGGSDG